MMTNLTNPGTGKALEKLADAFLAGEISREQLIEQTARLGLAPDLLDLLVTSQAHVATGPRTAAEKNKAIYQRFIHEVFNEGRFDRLDAFLSPAYVYRDAPPGTPPGADGIKQIVSMFRAAFPDLRITIEQQVAENDYVCSRTTMCGTHRGDLFGILATGNPVAVSGMTMVQVVDGRLVESWVKNDFMGLIKQLGVELPISR